MTAWTLVHQVRRALIKVTEIIRHDLINFDPQLARRASDCANENLSLEKDFCLWKRWDNGDFDVLWDDEGSRAVARGICEEANV